MAINGITDICRIKKIEYIFIHKKSKIYSNKTSLENSISKCDIVHIFGGWTRFYIQINILAKKLKKKIIIYPLSLNEPWHLSQKKIKNYLRWNLSEKNFLMKADLIHCANFKEEQSLKKLNSNFKTKILPFCIDQKNILKKIKKKIKKKCVFFLRANNIKDFDTLLKCWVDINNPNWSLDIITFGVHKSNRKIYDLRKYKKIRFLNYISKKSKKFRIFEEYDLLVLPPNKDKFNFMILEALARGLSVLTTNLSGWDIIQDKNAGWIINNSIIELKLVLNQIFNSSNKEILIKKKNTIKIAKKFTKESLSQLYFKTYKKMLIT